MSRLVDALPVDERAAAEAALADSTVVALPRGAQRVAERMPPAALLVIEDGVVAVTSYRPTQARRMVVDVGGAGSVVLPPERGERLEALTDAWVTAMTERARAALLRLPSAAAALVAGLEASVRAGRESLAQFGNVRRSDRLRDKLLQLAREHGRVDSFGVRLDLPLTHELLGEMVGASRETVTWAFAELAREGFVRRDGRLYRLAVSPDELAS